MSESDRPENEIVTLLKFAEAAKVCVSNIMYTEEAEHSEVEKSLGKPNFIEEAKDHTRLIVNLMGKVFKTENIHADLSKEEEKTRKDDLVNTLWPHSTIQALLTLHGVNNDSITNDNIPSVIGGQDKQFFDELSDICESYYDIILSHTNHNEATLPPSLITEAVSHAHKQQWIEEDDTTFSEWFYDALSKVEQQRGNVINNNNNIDLH